MEAFAAYVQTLRVALVRSLRYGQRGRFRYARLHCQRTGQA